MNFNFYIQQLISFGCQIRFISYLDSSMSCKNKNMLVDFGQKVVFFSKCVNIYIYLTIFVYKYKIKKMEERLR